MLGNTFRGPAPSAALVIICALASTVAAQDARVAGAVPDAVRTKSECADIGPTFSTQGLLSIIPGFLHEGDGWFGRFGPIDPDTMTGLMEYGTDGSVNGTSTYSIDNDAVCYPEDGGCEKYARCQSGEMAFVIWDPDYVQEGTPWAALTVTISNVAQIIADAPTAAPPSVSPKPDYAAPPVTAPAPVDFDDNEIFRRIERLSGLYIREDEIPGRVTRYWLDAVAFTHQINRTDDGRQSYRTRLSMTRERRCCTNIYQFAILTGGWDAAFNQDLPQAYSLDLTTLAPGALDMLTDTSGVASRAHWGGLLVDSFSSAVLWNTDSFEDFFDMNIHRKMEDETVSSIVLCDTWEAARDAKQIDFFDDGMCHRYDRVREVTSTLGTANAIQVAAALSSNDGLFYMRVGDIAVSGDAITLEAVMFRSKVRAFSSDGSESASWKEPSIGLSSRDRVVRCSFPMEDLDRLSDVVRGNVIGFYPTLDRATETSISLNCRLPEE